TLAEDHDGTLWVGTIGGGLNKFNRESETFTRFTTKEGLANDVIYGMLVDQEGCLWIGTENGLSHLNPKTQQFRNYTVEDGLPSNNFYWGTPSLAKDGECIFGTSNGVVLFHPRDIEPNLIPPSVVLTSFHTLYKPMKFDRDVSEVREIEITFRENVFSFEFAALDFTNPKNNHYAYRMEGFDDDWVYAGARRFTTYTNLNPGTYTFRVKGANSDGIWNDRGLAVKLMIDPPVWFRWWFMTLVGLLILGTVVYLYNWRVEKLLEVERTRDRIARDLHDDIASTLGSVALYIASLRGKLKKSPRETVRMLEKISSLSLEAIDSMSDIVWSVSPRNDTLNDLLIHMRDLTSQVCTANGIDYTIRIPPLADDIILKPDVRKNIYLVFKESLNNVIKHAHAKKLTVSAKLDKGIFQMAISDNGRGFDIENYGFGMKHGSQHEPLSRGHGLRSLDKRAK
ncbi:MAG: hypothetical protein HY966_01460, partial [Ignavibacteriales bacterium]|nr:hypothetical protein [Ignavibacteriales bacterium]